MSTPILKMKPHCRKQGAVFTGGEYSGLAFVILISAATEDELFDGMLLDVTNTIRPVK